MSGVYKRQSDKARGKRGRWTIWYTAEDGRRTTRAGFTDKKTSLELADHLESQARRVREGLAEPGEADRRSASRRPLAEHVADFRAVLIARGNTPKHVDGTASDLTRLLAEAGVTTLADLTAERVLSGLGRWREEKSARTCNKALWAVQAFARWLEESGRMARVPRGLDAIRSYGVAADRRHVRRALTLEELDRLLAAAEAGLDLCYRSRGVARRITGPGRAALYRLAMGTGFRANELRSLTPECFHLDGPEPVIVLPAKVAKNRQEAVQPITRELAAAFRPFLADRPAGQPVLDVPILTAAMLRADLASAGIPYQDGEGRVVDFHALRHSYITHLVRSGANPKVVQALARHSTITLTLDQYTHLADGEARDALEGQGKR